MYFIEYTKIPTRYNRTQVIETVDLSKLVCIRNNLSKYDSDKLTFTNHAERSLDAFGVIIQRIYKEDQENNQIHVLYQYSKHFGESLKDILSAAPTEILI